MLFGISDPSIAVRSPTAIDGTIEGTEAGHIEIAALRRVVTHREIGFAAREIGSLSRLDEF